MKKIKSEKGVITMVTLITVLFMVSFLITSYVLIANKVKTQKEILTETKKIYEPTSTMEEIYNSYFNNGDSIPIYTVQQLISIGNNEEINANNKIYTFSNNYILMEDLKINAQDLKLEKNWIIAPYNTEFSGNFDWNGYMIEVTNLNGDIVIYDGIGEWRQEEEEIKYITEAEQTTTTLKVGDKVNYIEKETSYTPTLEGTGSSATWNETEQQYVMEQNQYATENLEWIVLGANDLGQLELISTTPTNSKLHLAGKAGYKNAEIALNDLCNNLYGKGLGAASARSLNVEDINKLGNYIPEEGTKYTYKYYGSSIYGVETDKITNAKDITGWTDIKLTEFYGSDWTINSSNLGPYELENTYYYYTLASQFNGTDYESMADILTKGEEGDTYINQWIASKAIGAGVDNVGFAIRGIFNGDIRAYGLYHSTNERGDTSNAFRPIVTLKLNCKITDKDNDKVYEIN